MAGVRLTGQWSRPKPETRPEKRPVLKPESWPNLWRVALLGLLLLQGCASTEELFAEYDNKFCVVPEYPSQRFRWEPVVYFDSDKAQILSADFERLKTNVATLTELTGYKISLKGFADHQASNSYNEALSKQRVDNVADYLADELGLGRDRIITSSHGESSPLTNITSGPVDQDRRVEMLLLDSTLVPVASQPLLTQLSVTGSE